MMEPPPSPHTSVPTCLPLCLLQAVLKIEPDNTKALHRSAIAKHKLGQLEESLLAFR